MSKWAAAEILLGTPLKRVFLESEYLSFLVIKFELIEILLHSLALVIQDSQVVTGAVVPS